ncbi:Hachiman antiphage defense system protein HamA [Clostridium sp. CMCC3677]|uniref:Hachiman antiphage defense system protein HamA n=1 Tax=Clostridium sp. CMCC3677 TaxID=2949963 RepID=UPI0013F11BA4|nr:Hachiman antiphage defense system protein HamA [Clostridium sp. CMCC3677]NFG61369.1 DUF1837 domain-containing protein [Clostridium botulinum]NFQ09160.1 DUF1837 domain-containing protein [Clostridium botulinum]
MTVQDTMIGKHPNDDLFHLWTDCVDYECDDKKRYRHLDGKDKYRDKAIETIAAWLIKYHLSDSKRVMIERKQNILRKYEFQKYAESLHILPRTDKTKKGNFGEVVLSEYLSKTTGIKVLVYKLHYNPNVDQSMKGDDVLLVDKQKIILGESKFRATPNKKAVEDASELMGDSMVLPLSLGFIADRLLEQGDSKLAEEIFDIQYKIGKTDIDIKNVGFLISTKSVCRYVENNINSCNNEFIFLSLGIENPVDFMNEAFKKAEELLVDVNKHEN